MGKLGIFVDRQTLSSSIQLISLIKFREEAEKLGHYAYFIFPTEIKKISGLDALFIRARTDSMNISYVAARIAELKGIPVIDDPNSIRICSDKVNMYLHLMQRDVPMPRTVFMKKGEVTLENLEEVFKMFNPPIILKEPSTSFSARVERVYTKEEFIKVSRRFIKLSDWVVVQEFVDSKFDWRIGVLNGELLYACKYIIPNETFKIQASVNGHLVYCDVVSVPKEEVPQEIIDLGIRAGNAIGNGLYGVDIKESNGALYVIEVNDNPSLDGGEDRLYPDIYERIISYLMHEKIK
ncbi:MAG: RimK family alpha-L-glutamate ligase [Methanofastidiosum sp.]|jgi:glutathione synthase/RimK-type ligase-like ATP-grasp enzyme|nr:RimK family alpha-L-glutamate ligase [Methanofastidiosum sp.]